MPIIFLEIGIERVGNIEYTSDRCIEIKKKETGKEMWAMPHTILNESLLYIDFIYSITI